MFVSSGFCGHFSSLRYRAHLSRASFRDRFVAGGRIESCQCMVFAGLRNVVVRRVFNQPPEQFSGEFCESSCNALEARFTNSMKSRSVDPQSRRRTAWTYSSTSRSLSVRSSATMRSKFGAFALMRANCVITAHINQRFCLQTTTQEDSECRRRVVCQLITRFHLKWNLVLNASVVILLSELLF